MEAAAAAGGRGGRKVAALQPRLSFQEATPPGLGRHNRPPRLPVKDKAGLRMGVDAPSALGPGVGWPAASPPAVSDLKPGA